MLPTVKNSAAGYQDSVKIELLKSAGLLFLFPSIPSKPLKQTVKTAAISQTLQPYCLIRRKTN